jgi:hypothetical protein
LPFDQELRCFPILLKNKASIDWAKDTLAVTNMEGTDFRLWAPGEEPGTHVMGIYLNSDFDGVSMEFLVRTILLFNSGIPLSIDMIHNVENQFDRCPFKPIQFNLCKLTQNANNVHPAPRTCYLIVYSYRLTRAYNKTGLKNLSYSIKYSYLIKKSTIWNISTNDRSIKNQSIIQIN